MYEIYHNFISLQKNPATRLHSDLPILKSKQQKLTIILEHNGDTSGIEAAGFEIEGRQSEFALQGDIQLKDIEAVSQLSNVLLLRFGSPLKPSLSNSTSSINAQSTTASLTDGIWFYNDTEDTFSGNTGEGVVIGIIDTGIDWRHPSFFNVEHTDTRIISIWDQGLSRRSSRNETIPDANLLSPGTTTAYGVEFNKDKLMPGTERSEVRSKDKNGHGTHVASIAAGNGGYNQLDFDLSELGIPRRKLLRENIGVAPEASLIIVKLLDLDRNPRRNGSLVSGIVRFKDAVHYIINKAATLPGNPKVVINGSIGSTLHPHDGRGNEGRENREEILHTVLHGQQGRIGVFAAGNSGGKDQHLEITIPDGGSGQGAIEIPFQIHDTRTRRTRKNTFNLQANLYYKNDISNLNFAVKIPGRNNFESNVSLGNNQTRTFSRRRLRIRHKDFTAQSSHGNVSRNGIEFTLFPHNRRFFDRRGGNRRTYLLKITGTANSIIHLWHDGSDANLHLVFDQRRFVPVPNPISNNSAIVFSRQSHIESPAQSPDVLAVANYVIATNRFLNCESSRGPLLSYDTNPVIANKPDIAAPGTRIMAAMPLTQGPSSALAELGLTYPQNQFVSKSGTSMACPHIAGLVALLLQKNPNLTLAQVKQLLSTNSEDNLIKHFPNADCAAYATNFSTAPPTEPTVNAGANEIGGGRINARATHEATPTS